ncbi:MAG: tRNA (adenosine(37)-N6)-dimethylallyltransferase MiaA [Pirellulales bacterium]
MEGREFPPVRDCWFVTGPTASGKTQVGIALARRLQAEILSLDSMAIFRGLDIGTAKPTAADRAAVPHLLLDLASPDEDFSLVDYLVAAHAAVEEVRRRGRIPLFVGGTPLYLKALLRGLCEGPPADWDFRRAVEAEVREVGTEALHQRLQLVDPLSAAKLHPHDLRRIVRALEVHHLTGRPLSHQQTQFDELIGNSGCRVLALEWPRPVLHRRIEERVEQMFAAGLVDEVRGLLARYGQLSRTASQAVGYREVAEYLTGKGTWEETVALVQARTRQFARRQETWFRSLAEIRRLPLREGESADAIAGRMVELASATGTGAVFL